MAYIILMFLSTMFYPIDQLPTWFRTLAWLNPMTWQVDVLRESAGFLAFTLICQALAVRTIDRAG